MAQDHYDVMLSSTTQDLAEHRETIIKAIWRADMNPVAMEKDSAIGNQTPLQYSLSLVDEADIYVGVFAYRYGYIPDNSKDNPDRLSITELEYRRARALGIPTLIFVIGDQHNVVAADMEQDPEKFTKLQKLRKELTTNHVVDFFNSPKELGEQVFASLKHPKLEQAVEERRKQKSGAATSQKKLSGEPAPEIGLPKPPEPYYAHPYILTRKFFGRQTELKNLDEWFKSSDPVFVAEAIGGMGKSALLWYWATQQAGKEAPGFDGLIWWSCSDESDGSISSFLSKGLSYITGMKKSEISSLSRIEQEEQFVRHLSQHRYVVVIDGLERALVAYHRIDASRVRDDQIENLALKEEVPQQLTKSERLRQFVDPRDERFIQNLASSPKSKLMIGTRLLPHVFQDQYTGQLQKGIQHLRLSGIYPPDEALELLRYLGVRGNASDIKRFTAQFGNHALLLNVLAGRILKYRPNPGDFDEWYRTEGRNLALSKLQIDQRRTDILGYALDDLSPQLLKLLGQVSAFRYPVEYNALKALNPFGSAASDDYDEQREAASKLNSALDELEERRLLIWDRASNRYDLHPVVRSMAFERLERGAREDTYLQIKDYFSSLPPDNLSDAESVNDIRHTIEIYNALIGSGQLDSAANFLSIFSNQLLREIGASYTVIELIHPFFPDGLDHLPDVEDYLKGNILNELASAYQFTGQMDTALKLYRMYIKHELDTSNLDAVTVCLTNYAEAVQEIHRIREARRLLEFVIQLEEEIGYPIRQTMGTHLYMLQNYVECGEFDQALSTYNRVIREFAVSSDTIVPGAEYCKLLSQHNQDAGDMFQSTWKLVVSNRKIQGQMTVKRWWAEYELQHGNILLAQDHIQEAITIAQKSSDGALAAQLGCLARIQLQSGNANEAEKTIQHALGESVLVDEQDLYCSAAEIYIGLGEPEKAKTHVLNAYRTAWADGPPFSHWWDLQRTRVLLAQLNQPEPSLAVREDSESVFPYEDELRLKMRNLRNR